MIYSLDNYILFSLIYSSAIYSSNGGKSYAKQEYKSDILFEIFKTSILYEENIFTTSTSKKIEIIDKATEILLIKNPKIRDIDSRKRSMEELFLKNNRLEEFIKQIPLEINLLEKHNIKTIVYEDKKYPKHLKELNDSPFIIYYKGYFPTNKELNKSLAIIGTREPEEKYGKEIARRVGNTLLNKGWWNISGLAVGCDEYGHKGSIGATGAILAQGLATPVFPKENTELACNILDNEGFLMSELPPSIKPNSIFFVLRDRLQSGLTKGIFVVETSCKSGTLHTVKYALEQKRNVFIWNPSSIQELLNKNEVQGNIGLLDRTGQKYGFNVSIPKSLKQNTISIINNNQLIGYLENIEKELIEKNENELVEEKNEFFQNKLF